MYQWPAALSLSLLIGLSACGDGSGKPGPAGAATGAPPPLEVDLITVATADATVTQDLPGRLLAFRTAQVRARVEGVIEQRLFAEGSDVAAGTPLFRIDPRSYQAATAAAEAEAALAKANFERYKPLLEIKAVSQQEYDQAAAKLKQAEAALTKARLDMENATPSAPISGRIGRTLVTEGALVGKGEASHLATIEQLNPMRVEFSQSYSDVLRLQQAIKAGKRRAASVASVRLLLEDGTLYPEAGQLRFADMAVEPSTGAVLLRAEFPNPRRELLPGTFVRVRFPQAEMDGVMRIPQRAVSASPQGQMVMVVGTDDKVAPRPIKTAGMSGADFIIESGLQPGDRVIVNGLQKARPGSVVKPVPWNSAAPLSGAASPAPILASPKSEPAKPMQAK